MLSFTEYTLQDLHGHKDYRSTYLCYTNYVCTCREQDDEQALRLDYTEEFRAACKNEYNVIITNKVPEAVRAGAADLLTGEIDHQVEAAKEELGHSRSATTRPLHESSANALPPLSSSSETTQYDHAQQSDEPNQSDGSTDRFHEENQPEVDLTEEEITRAKATPFYDLILHIFKKTRGEVTTLPDFPTSISSLNHKEMAKYAYKDLDKSSNVSKDIINGIYTSSTIKFESLLPWLSPRMSTVEALLSDLLSALCPGIKEDPYAEPSLLDLQLKVWELLSQFAKLTVRDKEQKAVHAALMTMSHICSLLAIGQLEPPTSEHVYVSAWTQIFNTLFHGSKVRAIPGELMSTAAKNCRLLIEDEFGQTNKYICGRKVDMSIRVYADHTWDNEICVFEFKSSNASEALCRQQQRKSVRLNGAILLDLEKRGLDITKSYPVIAEGRGLVVDFYTLRRYEDILGAGRSTMSSVWLPSHVSQLKPFLKSNSLHVLLEFAGYPESENSEIPYENFDSKKAISLYYQRINKKNPHRGAVLRVSIKKSKPKGDRVSSGIQKKSLADLDKNGLVRSMNWRHPTSSLEIGTVRANVRRAVMDGVAGTDALTKERQEVVDCFQEAPRLAAGVKLDNPANIDKDEEDAGGIKENDDSDVANRQDKEFHFLISFLTYLYSGNYPKENSKAGGVANQLVVWLVKDGIHDPFRARRELQETAPFTPTYLVRSVSGQLAVELRRVYGHRSRDLHDKLKVMKDKGIVRGDVDIQIRPDVSAVENFPYLNKLTGNSRRIGDCSLFWKRTSLKERLVRVGELDNSTITSVNDLDTWIAGKEPGYIIKNFVADVAPQGLTSRQRKQADHRSAVKLWSLDQIRSHLVDVQNEWLDPITYATKGYVLRGSLKTDGFRIQLLAFKLRELQDVRFRRIAEDRLPSRLTSTVGGIDYFLPEIRNVITSKDDVTKYWPGVQPEEIKALTLDGGRHQQTTTSPLVSTRAVFHNLTVKQKAVYQPTFRFRRWLEGEKQALLDVGEEHRTIARIETELPPLKGEGASVINYTAELRRVEERLLKFYAGLDQLYKRHKWDKERARQYEYQLLADRLLGIVGGSIGRRYDPVNPVLIGVGLGKFSIRSGLSSLDSTFLSFFVQKARSLGYLVVGLNGYYTSKKCPHCGLFVAQVTLRRFFCPTCHVCHHRDVMAAENKANLVRGYLEKQQRPEHLQPVAPDGSLPWMASAGAGSEHSRTQPLEAAAAGALAQ
ncbi:hypothetical protein KI688_009753 [Linnemannia hyalina]|uniref:Cas12f1-like TNB domain-containing protein n=1 Tax=Linnemannia hyalina TaxID=64524 RepID=A0A9P7Y079_9FUNG|nr:hypothetical protein KI688_009753 [Linnemannia hyalina]